MEAQAFVEPDIDALFELGLSFLPVESLVARLVRAGRTFRFMDEAIASKFSGETRLHSHRAVPMNWFGESAILGARRLPVSESS
jgi:hypothetical protein